MPERPSEMILTASTLPGDLEGEWPEPSSHVAAAARDILQGLQKYWMWSAMAAQDLRLRYRGSLLGPFWLTISTVIMVSAMGVMYAELFRVDVAVYLPFLTIGIIVWGYITTTINEGCATFLAASGVIQQVPIPFSVHVCRVVCRNLMVLGHNIVIIPVVLLLFPKPLGWSLLLLIPAAAVLVLNSVWVALLLGMLSARFRDIPPIVTNFVQVIFFVTPIFWSPDMLRSWRLIAELNPFFSLIDIVRAPMLGIPAEPLSWPVSLAFTVTGCVLTFAFFARFRTRIPYWL